MTYEFVLRGEIGDRFGLLNERAELARDVGRAKERDGRRAIRDVEREREVLLRVTMANAGPIPQADLLAIYRRLMAATRSLEARDRKRERLERDAGRTVLTGPVIDQAQMHGVIERIQELGLELVSVNPLPEGES